METKPRFTADVSGLEESEELMLYISRPGITEEEVTQVYEKWAEKYNQTISNIVWNAPKYGADEILRIFGNKKDVRILDAASGTGLCGILLRKNGFTSIDALDASENMLIQSKKTGAYQNFICAYMGPNKLEIENDTYDAVVTVGSFVPGHVKEDCYEELIRITKPGGYIVIAMCERFFRENKSYTANIEPRMLALQEHGIWNRVKREQVPNYYQEYDGIVFVLQVLEEKNDKLATLK